jgi:regulation of enolase protein 1 (concanavalin A-like superfamily)
VLIKTKILHGGFKMEFKWLNKSTITKEGKRIEIFAPKESDFFCNNGAVGDEGITPESLSNAPFYYTEVTGDFIMKVKVSHDFKDMYDSSSIMVMQDMTHWAKACFELTDFNTHAVVSVVTKDQSDDANGCNIDGNSVWLQVCRVGQSFAFHYSIDGDNYYMMRFFNLPAEKTLKVGLLAQAPTGSGGIRIYEDLTIEKKKVKNIRMGK